MWLLITMYINNFKFIRWLPNKKNMVGKSRWNTQSHVDDSQRIFDFRKLGEIFQQIFANNSPLQKDREANWNGISFDNYLFCYLIKDNDEIYQTQTFNRCFFDINFFILLSSNVEMNTNARKIRLGLEIVVSRLLSELMSAS